MAATITPTYEFLSTLSLRRATFITSILLDFGKLFLSTLSLRRATAMRRGLAALQHRYFYPRSPCGERPVVSMALDQYLNISIHALLAESDLSRASRLRRLSEFLSTLSLRRATTAFYADCLKSTYFYPRSPCGERPQLASLKLFG